MAEPRLPPNEKRALPHPSPQIPVEPVQAPNVLVELRHPQPVMQPESTTAQNAVVELFHRLRAMEVDQKVAPPQEPIVKEYPMTGAWLPGPDPLVIGPQNYTVLQNLRYREGELRSVLGYTAITPSSHPIYGRGRSGIQFHKLINAQLLSILLVQAYNSALNASAVLLHTPAPPETGDFNAAELHIDTPGAGLGRFALAPNQHVVYCNGRESRIWAGEETRIGAFYASAAGLTPLRDYTDAVRDISQGEGDIALLNVGGSNTELYIGTTRPSSGFKFYILAPNTTPRSLLVYYWGDGGWTPTPGGHTDGTAVAGVPMARTGSLAFLDTQHVAKPRWFQDQVLYFYKIEYSGPLSGGTSVYYATTNMAWQPIRDLWDGVERKIIFLEVIKSSAHKDYTLEATEAESTTSSVTTSTGDVTSTTEGTSGFSVPLGGLTSGDKMIIGFSQPVMGIRFKMGNRIQGNGSTFTIKYWDGNGYATPQNFIDEAAQLGRSGVMHWTPVRPGLEFPQLYGGLLGYFYEVGWSATLSSEVDLDQVTGIAAPRRIGGYAFPFSFQGQLMLCGDLVGNEGHKVDYSAPNRTEVWNGEQASAEGKQLFFGDGGTLTCAAEIYNRYAGTLAYIGVFCKQGETWVLLGNSPDSYQIFPVSKTIGCPAPLTMDTAEVAYSVAEDAQRQIALWLSAQGPVAFDGSVIVPLPGLEPYFDQSDPRHINIDFMVNSRGWFDREYKEYNLTFPSGTGQVTNNVHVVYDLRRQRWYEKTPATYMQGVVKVSDASGRTYTYGLVDTGHMLRLEHGFTWGGSGILQVWETADILPENSTFTETLLRYFRVVAKGANGLPANIVVTHYADFAITGTGLPSIGVTGFGARMAGALQRANRTAISHRFRFQAITTDQQLSWLMFGAYFERVRQRGR